MRIFPSINFLAVPNAGGNGSSLFPPAAAIPEEFGGQFEPNLRFASFAAVPLKCGYCGAPDWHLHVIDDGFACILLDIFYKPTPPDAGIDRTFGFGPNFNKIWPKPNIRPTWPNKQRESNKTQ